MCLRVGEPWLRQEVLGPCAAAPAEAAPGMMLGARRGSVNTQQLPAIDPGWLGSLRARTRRPGRAGGVGALLGGILGAWDKAGGMGRCWWLPGLCWCEG